MSGMAEMAEMAEVLRAGVVINTSGSLSDPNRPSVTDMGGIEAPVMTPRIISDARAAGVTAINMTFGYVFGDAEPYALTKADIEAWDRCIAENAADLLKILSAADIERAKSEGRIGLIFAFQNAEMFGHEVSRVREFADMGVRVMQLTYNTRNLVGAGSLVADDMGLSDFGREVVAAINASRVIVDLSHSNRQTCLDAIEASSQPVAITHTGCRALVDIPRNKSDLELRQVAERGGYVGIYFMPFLASGRNATSADLVAHIAHAINVCGEDSVGIGTDNSFTPFDDLEKFKKGYAEIIMERRARGISAPGEEPDIYPFVEDLVGTDQLNGLVAAMEQHGFSASVIDKVLGQNFLGYARRIWGS